jgi:hypothetical protein
MKNEASMAKSESDNDWWSIFSSFKQSRVANKIFISTITLKMATKRELPAACYTDKISWLNS